MPRRKREASPTYELEDDYEDDGSGQPPIQRNAANARERARMRVLSSAFCRLKTKLPWVPPDTKLSKLDTLRLATGYIQQLQTVLAGDLDDGMTGVLRPPTLSWPFTFQQQHDMRQTSTTPSSSSDHWSPPRDSPEPMIHHYRGNHSIYGAIVHGQ